jgi:hypothetical protein
MLAPCHLQRRNYARIRRTRKFASGRGCAENSSKDFAFAGSSPSALTWSISFVRKKLIVEVDGGQHADSASDEERTHWLEAQGYRVVRFWNNDVLSNTEGLLVRILEALRAGPPSLPSPSRGEGIRGMG